MADTQTVFLKHRIVDEDNDHLLIEFYRKALAITEHLILWKSSDLLDALPEMPVGEVCLQAFEPEETGALPCPQTHRVPVLSLQNPESFRVGQIVEDPTRNLIGRVIKTDDAWVTIEPFITWIRGKRVRIESELLKRRPASEGEIGACTQIVSLHPIQDAH